MNRGQEFGSIFDVDALVAHRKAAADRLSNARRMCDASANQSMPVQAEATRDLLNAEAVAQEWCTPRELL